MTNTVLAASASGARIRRDGWLCLAGGLVGAAQAAFLLVVPASVGTDRYSYPFDATGFRLAQSSFFVQHLFLIFGLWAVYQLPPLRRSRIGRLAALGSIVGMVLLALVELAAITAAGSPTKGGAASLINGLYGVPVLLLGASLVTTGVAALRTPRPGWVDATWLPLVITVLGVYVFVPLIPAIAGPFVAGRIGIGVWMLLFALVGYGLTRIRPGSLAATPTRQTGQ
jgi:hypothetical protein